MMTNLRSPLLISWSFLFLSGLYSHSGADAAGLRSQLWSNDYNGAQDGPDIGTGVAIDSTGNVYTSGTTNNTPPAPTPTDSAAEGVKYDKNGTAVTTGWPVSVDTTNGLAVDAFYGAAVDSNDDVYFIGNTYQVFGGFFYPSVLLLQKYSPTGSTPVWEKNLPATPGTATDDSVGHAITVDTADNVYVAGYRNDAIGVSTNDDWVLAKYDSSGTEAAWSPIYLNNEYATDQNGNDQAFGLAVDSQGSIIVAGSIGYDASSTDLGWKIIKYDSVGVETTSWTYNAWNYRDIAYAVAVDSQDDIVVVGTQNYGTDNESNSKFDWVVRKYDGTTYDVVWSETFTDGTSTLARAVVIDEQDRIYIGGKYNDGVTDRWRLEVRSGSDGALLMEKTWSDLSDAGIQGLSLRDDTLAITGYADVSGNRDWHTELWDVSSFPWTTFLPATTNMKP